MFLATLYVVNINAIPHRRANDEFENYGFVSCNPNIPRELNVSHTPNPLVSNTLTTFEVAGRLLIDGPRSFYLNFNIFTDATEYHELSEVVPAKPLGAGELFNLYENFTMPPLSERYKVRVSLNSPGVTLACVNKTI